MQHRFIVLGGLLLAGPVVAADLFTMDVKVDGDTETFNFSYVEGVFNQVDEQGLESAFTNYSDTSTMSADINYRGLPMTLNFIGNSTDLQFDVPSLGISETFSGTTRDDSSQQFEDYLTSEGDELLNQIQKALIATSPVDPIAGNPNSLMSNMVSGQFESAFTSETSQIAEAAPRQSTTGTPTERQNLVALGARFGRYTADGFDSEVITLPLGYSINRDGDSSLRSINLSLPITLTDTNGAKSANIALGIGMTFALSDRWSLTPAVAAGVVGSVDLGSAGGIGSTSLTSTYRLPLNNGYSLGIGNMVGYFKTLEFEIDDYSFDPGVANTVARNGLLLSQPFHWGDRDLAVEYWVTDTRFFGDKLYSEYYDEVGISIGLAKRADGDLDNYLRAGISYLWGDGDVSGFKLNFGYAF